MYEAVLPLLNSLIISAVLLGEENSAYCSKSGICTVLLSTFTSTIHCFVIWASNNLSYLAAHDYKREDVYTALNCSSVHVRSFSSQNVKTAQNQAFMSNIILFRRVNITKRKKNEPLKRK